MAIYKRDRIFKLGTTEKQIPLVAGWRPRTLWITTLINPASNPGPPDYNIDSVSFSTGVLISPPLVFGGYHDQLAFL